MKFKIKLVPGWRNLWRAFSVNIPALNAAILATWAALPENLRAVLPVSWLLGIAVTLIALGIIGRVIDQKIERKP